MLQNNVSINSSKLYLGRNAGDKILISLRLATKSIKIATAYISSEYIDFLIEKAESNVDVSLILSSEFSSDQNSRIKIYRKLIQQTRITDHKKKRLRFFGLCLVILSYFIVLVFLFVGYIEKFPHFKYANFLFPLLIFTHLYLKKMRIYNYTYKNKLNFTVIMSPYSSNNSFNENFYLAHAKIYIIDEEISFLGSMNFTRMGFNNNYESRMLIEDLNDVGFISNEFDYLYANNSTSYLDLVSLARSIYEEPPN